MPDAPGAGGVTAGTVRNRTARLLHNPIAQGLAVWALAVAAMAANRLLGKAGFEWVIGALALLIFEVANPVVSAWARSWWRYALVSMAVAAVLFLMLPVCAMLVSEIGYGEIGETAMVYLVIMYYPFTLGLAGLARLILRLSGRGRPDGPDGSSGGN